MLRRPATTRTMAHAPARLAQLTQHLAPSSSSNSTSTAPHRAASSSATTGEKAGKSVRPQPPRASDFRYFLPFQTRWADNDKYGHMNNVVYSLYFDSITNHYLIHQVPRPPSSPPPLGLIVSSSTSYASSLSYPSPIVAALAVSNLSARSVTWRIALFEGEYVPPLDAGGEVGMDGFSLDSLREGAVGRKVRVKKDEKSGEEVRAAAWGEMVHVFVEEESRRPLKEMGEGLRRALERLLVRSES
ncbi:hypothetical protein JCM10049v2_006668 [Rhodotorula toruloides]